MFAVSDLRTGGRQSNAAYQYTLLSDDPQELYAWSPKLTQALMGNDIIKDVNSDQQLGGLQTNLTIDRDTAMRLGLTLSAIDNTLYDAFGQRQVSTIYNALNQYHVVMEIAPRYWQDPRTLDQIYVSTSGANPTGVQQTGIAAGDFTSSTGPASTAATIAADSARNLATNSLAVSGHSAASTGAAVTTSLETMVPLSAFAKFEPGHTPLSVNHQGQFARRRFRSTWRRAARSAKPRRRSTRRSNASACLRPSVARSPAPPRPSSNRNRACRFCSAPRW